MGRQDFVLAESRKVPVPRGIAVHWVRLVMSGLALANLVGCVGWVGDPRDNRLDRVGFFSENNQIGLAHVSCGLESSRGVPIDG